MNVPGFTGELSIFHLMLSNVKSRLRSCHHGVSP